MLSHPRSVAVVVLLAAALLGLVHADGTKPPATVDFKRDVQPLFQKHCFTCHGPEKQRSGLRLDRRSDALKGGDSGPVIVPGKSNDSSLVHYVIGRDGKFMPPKGERLAPQQVGILRRWIDQGAIWPQDAGAFDPRLHWAFQTPTRPSLPSVRRTGWCRTPIDRFILARLEKEELSPSPEADRVTLLRRLHLDLIGLPPSPQEVDEFLADRSTDAYEKAVQRLLDSKHYGERWGRHWLDAARYADSDGYEKDKGRQIWFYRDWVINAFNRDLPYDRFIIEQLGGDLLPNATQDQIVATGFLRNSMINEEGGVDPEQFRMDAMFDRMDAVGKAVLGLSIACAQCHNHKYDPLTQEEYYRLFAYLNSDYESQRVVYTPGEQQKVAELRRRMRDAEERLRHETPDWEQRMAKWEESVRGHQPPWEVLKIANAGDNGQRYFEQKDSSLLAQGYAPTKFTAHFTATTPSTKVTAFRLELLNHANLPCNGPGRSVTGTCALSEFTVEAADAREPGKKAKVKLVQATADFGNPERPLEQTYDDRSKKKRVTGPIEYAIDGKDDTAWGIDAGPGRRNLPRNAVFVADKPIEFPNGTMLHIYLKQNHGGWNSDDNQNNNLGRFRLSVTDAANPGADTVPSGVRKILAVPADKRSPVQVAAVFRHWRTTVPEFQKINDAIEELWKQWPEGSTTLTLRQREEMRTTNILKRGDFLNPTRPVQPGVPAFLHPLADNDAPRNRLTLARWLVDRRSPTTARAFVNRVWQTYFGTGLVSTSEDLGTQSQKPSHPELLDWLAVEFMESAKATPWSIKNLHRLIVLSATYRQSSRLTPQMLQRDPSNQLLARMSRLRVEGEVVRDIALSAGGLLNSKMGGPAVFAPAPQFLFKPPASYGPFEWTEATGTERYRRAVYTFRRRSTPYPVLTAFDVPPGESSCVRRVRSNTALQALTTLNESVFVDCARGLALRTVRDGGRTDEERIRYAFHCCLARPPSATETTALLRLLESQRRRIAEGQLKAEEILGEMKADAVPVADLAGYVLVARVLLNLDETITRE